LIEMINAVLMRKHDVVVVGKTPEDALDTAIVREDVATIYIRSCCQLLRIARTLFPWAFLLKRPF
jgi:ribulose-5-phosphate 4-epimerase/fuculose-1-phosphate aldolase